MRCSQIVAVGGERVTDKTDWQKLTVSERLAILEVAMGAVSQQDMAGRILRTEYDAYNVVRRKGALSTKMATAIVTNCPGIDFGWLYQGLPGNLTVDMYERLGRATSKHNIKPQPNRSDAVQFRILLDHENRIRALEGKTAIGEEQFESAQGRGWCRWH
jgi:hypothetical protein